MGRLLVDLRGDSPQPSWHRHGTQVPEPAGPLELEQARPEATLQLDAEGSWLRLFRQTSGSRALAPAWCACLVVACSIAAAGLLLTDRPHRLHCLHRDLSTVRVCAAPSDLQSRAGGRRARRPSRMVQRSRHHHRRSAAGSGCRRRVPTTSQASGARLQPTTLAPQASPQWRSRGGGAAASVQTPCSLCRTGRSRSIGSNGSSSSRRSRRGSSCLAGAVQRPHHWEAEGAGCVCELPCPGGSLAGAKRRLIACKVGCVHCPGERVTCITSMPLPFHRCASVCPRSKGPSPPRLPHQRRSTPLH